MKVLLHYYDKVVEENEALRARIKELEEEKVKYINIVESFAS